MKLIRYAEWSRRARGADRQSHPIGATKGVTLHWEGPHMGAFPHSKCAEKVRGIQAFHRDGRKWADIAYNALVCPHGYVFEGRGPGVTSAANGNEQDNADWYAVCYLGGLGDPFTPEAQDAFVDAVDWLRTQGGAGPRVNGHRDHKATQCPGDQIHRWLHNRDWTPTTKEDDMFTDQDRALLMELAKAQKARADRSLKFQKRVTALLESIVGKLDRLLARKG